MNKVQLSVQLDDVIKRMYQLKERIDYDSSRVTDASELEWLNYLLKDVHEAFELAPE